MIIEHDSISTGRRESTAVASKEPLKEVVETMTSFRQSKVEKSSIRQSNVEKSCIRQVSVRHSNTTSSTDLVGNANSKITSSYLPSRIFSPNKVEPLLENTNYDNNINDKNKGNKDNNSTNNNDNNANNDNNSGNSGTDNNNNDNINDNNNMMMMFPIPTSGTSREDDSNTLHSGSMSISMLQPVIPHTVLITLPQITVLIVDDSAMNRKVVRRLIEGYLIMENFKGYELIIIEADDGTVAIDILVNMNNKKQRIDLVLLGRYVCVIEW